MSLDGDADAVCQVEIGFLSRVLDQPHNVAGPTLGLQFLSHSDVEHNDASAAIKGLGCTAVLGLKAHIELARFEHDLADLDPSIVAHTPVTRALGGEDSLHLWAVDLAERWIDLQLTRAIRRHFR